MLGHLAKLGVLRACVPAAFGGLRDRVELRDLVVTRFVLGELSPLADTMFAMQGLGSYTVTLAGSGAQRQALLAAAAAGTKMCAFAVTEPDAGSDVAAMKTLATRDGEGYAIRGEKIFISNAGLADSYVVFVRTSDDRKRGLSAFLVAGDCPGLVAEPMRLLGDHPIGRLRLDLRVPASARIGEEGDGLSLALSTLDFFRATVGAAATGMAQRALTEAIARAKTRRQFGKTLAEQQATQLAIADIALDVQASRLLCLDAAEAIDAHLADGSLPRALGEKAAMAKLFATEAAQRSIDRALQLWGGAGLIEGTAVERLYREVRALRIYEGTSEIQRLVIARAQLS
jgi:acyl-CoA dehydrogenase